LHTVLRAGVGEDLLLGAPGEVVGVVALGAGLVDDDARGAQVVAEVVIGRGGGLAWDAGDEPVAEVEVFVLDGARLAHLFHHVAGSVIGVDARARRSARGLHSLAVVIVQVGDVVDALEGPFIFRPEQGSHFELSEQPIWF